MRIIIVRNGTELSFFRKWKYENEVNKHNFINLSSGIIFRLNKLSTCDYNIVVLSCPVLTVHVVVIVASEVIEKFCN